VLVLAWVFLLCRDVDLYFFDWCRAPSPSHAVVAELQGKLLAREKELDSREGAIATRENGLVAFKRALGKVLMESDAGHV
jgi:hypothetical protein